MATKHKHPSGQSPYQTQRDPKTGQWITVSDENLQAQRAMGRNPFHAYRDPDTGKWCIFHPDDEEEA